MENEDANHASPHVQSSVTCVRVPVYRAHSIAVSAEFQKPVTVETAYEVLRKAPALMSSIIPRSPSTPSLFTSGSLQLRRRALAQRLRDGKRPVLLGQWRPTPQGRSSERSTDRGRADEVAGLACAFSGRSDGSPPLDWPDCFSRLCAGLTGECFSSVRYFATVLRAITMPFSLSIATTS